MLPLVADVSDFAAMQTVVTRIVDKWGRLDAVICNAAIMPLIPFTETTPTLWNKIIGVSMTGVYNTVKAAWDQLVAQGGGHCMAIASGASLRGFVDEAAYCAAKHGLEDVSPKPWQWSEPVNIAVNTMDRASASSPPTSPAEYDALPAEERAAWVDPVESRRPPSCGWPRNRRPVSPACASTPVLWPTPSSPKATNLSSRRRKSRCMWRIC
ncbi:MAG: SDR family oxidoreductase [Caldilineaceae bacterium]